eukprot:351638-Chlamydomonas_euryale.AAC.6
MTIAATTAMCVAAAFHTRQSVFGVAAAPGAGWTDGCRDFLHVVACGCLGRVPAVLSMLASTMQSSCPSHPSRPAAFEICPCPHA